MITLLFTLAFVALAQENPDCRSIEGVYRIADGRGRSIDHIEARIEQDGCSIVVSFEEQVHQAIVEGDRITHVEHTGDIDGEGRILWSNGYYYIPSHMEDVLFPAECLHPFALHCFETCAECIPCVHGEDLAICSDCGRCESCLDYIPCMEPIQHMPECLEDEAFQCLRECRQCADFGDCMDLQSQVDPICLTFQAAECLDQCAECAPCATGEGNNLDCERCGEECSQCADYAFCLDQVAHFPEEQRKCVSSDAIECFNDCGDCADKMYCLEAFDHEKPETSSSPVVIVEGEKFVEIRDYPCRTHGQEAPNQMFRMVGMGGNGFEIFRGVSNPNWWMYYDTNCGMTTPAHQPAWFVTVAEPDFDATENLGGRIDGCTNTMQIVDYMQTFQPRLGMKINNFMCDDGMWENEFTRNGFEVTVDMGYKRVDPVMCCEAETAECMACSSHMSREEFCAIPDNAWVPGCEHPMCCRAWNAECLSCDKGMSIEEFCTIPDNFDIPGCHHECVDDDEGFRNLVLGVAEHHPELVGNPEWANWLDQVREHGCSLLHDENTGRDWCERSPMCQCACSNHVPTNPIVHVQHCDKDEECRYEGCDAGMCVQRAAGEQFCMVDEYVCPQLPVVPLNEERCMNDADCQFDGCVVEGENVMHAHCSGSLDDWRDCSKGECVCVSGRPDARCEDRDDRFRLFDGAWCENGRRDQHCPANQERDACLHIQSGNYEIRDIEEGKPVAHMALNQNEGCTGEARMADGEYLRLEVFQNFVLAETPDHEVFTGVPNALGGFDWNEKFQSYPVHCIVVYQGTYNLINPESVVIARHNLYQDGCTATSIDDENGEIRWTLTPDMIFGHVGDEYLEGHIDDTEGPHMIRWNNGYTSRPVMDDDEPECSEDSGALLSYVRSVAVNDANPRIRDFINAIEMSGCDVLRHDHDAKFDWCTFHPEARRACSCVCEEVNNPKPVCSRQQMQSWLHRELSFECTELFVAGLAEEHRPSCDCLRTISGPDAEEMFASECHFHEWSDRSFMQLWRDCNHH